EAATAAGAAESADAGETVIVEHHDVQLVAFLDRRDDLLRHHEVGAVADHDVDFALRIGHFDAEAAGDFIAHGGIAVFEVVALGIARAPQLVQVARQAAGRAHNYVARLRDLIHHADHLSLADRRAVPQVVDAVHLLLPLGAKTAEARGVFGV